MQVRQIASERVAHQKVIRAVHDEIGPGARPGHGVVDTEGIVKAHADAF